MSSSLKIFLVLYSIWLIPSKSQNPVPLPSINLTSLEGLWWVQWQLNNQQNASDYKCYYNLLQVSGLGINIKNDYEYKGEKQDVILSFDTTAQQNTVWQYAGGSYQLNILDFDLFNSSWMVLGSNTQAAFIVSRSQVPFTQLFIKSQILLLSEEGYSINSTNSASYNNTECTSQSWDDLVV